MDSQIENNGEVISETSIVQTEIIMNGKIEKCVKTRKDDETRASTSENATIELDLSDSDSDAGWREPMTAGKC
jgi:hypothetical protein